MPMSQNIQNSLSIYGQIMQALNAPEQMKMQQQINQANLQKTQLANQYYPQSTEAEINYKNALAAAAQQKGDMWQSDIGKTQADLKKIRDVYGPDSEEYKGAMDQLNTKLSEQKAMTASRQAYADISGYNALPQTAKDSIFSSFLQSGIPAEYFPSYAASMTKRYLLSQPNAQQSTSQPAIGQAPISANPMTISPQGIQQLANAPQPQATALGITAPQTPSQSPMQSAVGPALAQQINPTVAQPISPASLGLQVSPEQQAASKDTADLIRSKLIKEGTTAAQLNQRLFGDMFKSMTDKITPNMPAITKFSGTYGKTGAALDRALAAVGSSKNDPDFLKYDQFIHVDLPGSANELRRTMAGQATDAEIKSVTDLLNPNDWAATPQMAMNRWNRMIEQANTARKSGYKSQAQLAREFAQEDKQPSVAQQLAQSTGMKAPEGQAPKTQFEVKSANGQKLIKGPDGKWYKRTSSGLVEYEGGQ